MGSVSAVVKLNFTVSPLTLPEISSTVFAGSSKSYLQLLSSELYAKRRVLPFAVGTISVDLFVMAFVSVALAPSANCTLSLKSIAMVPLVGTLVALSAGRLVWNLGASWSSASTFTYFRL